MQNHLLGLLPTGYVGFHAVAMREVTDGCRAWALCSGRISQLPRAAINLDLPESIDSIGTGSLEPRLDATAVSGSGAS